MLYKLARSWCLAILLFATIPVLIQSQALGPLSHPGFQTFAIAVDVPMNEWLDNYLAWLHRHPNAIHKDASGDPEFFSPNGTSIYRGSKDAQNAAFIKGLNGKVPIRSSVTEDGPRPDLQAYLEMAVELKPYESHVLSTKKYTVLAVTYKNNARCKSQNDALRQLANPNIQVVEISLKPE
jgi:hypothetical protein